MEASNQMIRDQLVRRVQLPSAIAKGNRTLERRARLLRRAIAHASQWINPK